MAGAGVVNRARSDCHLLRAVDGHRRAVELEGECVAVYERHGVGRDRVDRQVGRVHAGRVIVAREVNRESRRGRGNDGRGGWIASYHAEARVGDLQCPTVQRSGVPKVVVGDLQRPRAGGDHAVDVRERALGLEAAGKRSAPCGNGNTRFVVQDGLGKVIAAAAHVGQQLDAGPVGGDQVDVQIVDPGMGDVQLDVQVDDGESFWDRNRGSHCRVVDQSERRVGGLVAVDVRVVDDKVAHVLRARRAVSVRDGPGVERIGHLTFYADNRHRVADGIRIHQAGGRDGPRAERQVVHAHGGGVDRLVEVQGDLGRSRRQDDAFGRTGRRHGHGDLVGVERRLPGAGELTAAGAANGSGENLHLLRAVTGHGRRIEVKRYRVPVDQRERIGRHGVDRQIGRIDGCGVVIVREVDGEIGRRRGDDAPGGRRTARHVHPQLLQGAQRVEPTAGDDRTGERSERVGALQQGGADFGHAGLGGHRPRQGSHAGYVRRGHAGPRIGGVAAARNGAVDRDARRGQVDRRGTIAAEIGEIVVMVGGRHREHVGQIIIGGIMRVGIVVTGAVAGRRHEEDPGVAAGLNGVVHRRTIPAASPAIVGHPNVHAVGGPHHRGVVDRPNGIGNPPGSAGGEELQAHDRAGPVHAGHSLAVVACARDGAGHVRAVVVIVHRIAIIVDEIVAVDVVDEPVTVVVDTVSGDLAGVGPNVGRQIGVSVVDAGVDHRHHNTAASSGDVPGG